MIVCILAERPRDFILEETNVYQNPLEVGWTQVWLNHLKGHWDCRTLIKQL